MKRIPFLMLFMASCLFGAQEPSKKFEWPKFNSAAQTATATAASKPYQGIAEGDAKAMHEDSKASGEFKVDAIHAPVQPKSLTIEQRKLLSTYIALTRNFENSDNVFAHRYLFFAPFYFSCLRGSLIIHGAISDAHKKDWQDFHIFMGKIYVLVKKIEQSFKSHASSSAAAAVLQCASDDDVILLNQALRYSVLRCCLNVPLLLGHGADPNAVNSNGATPLIRFASGRHHLGLSAEQVDELYLPVSDNIDFNEQLHFSQTLIADLISYGANVNACTKNGFTALHAASLNANYARVLALKAAKAAGMKKSLNAVNNFGYTPIMCAAQNFYGRRNHHRQLILGTLDRFAKKAKISLSSADECILAGLGIKENNKFPALATQAQLNEKLKELARANVLAVQTHKNNQKNILRALAQREVGASHLRIKYKAMPYAKSDEKDHKDNSKSAAAVKK